MVWLDRQVRAPDLHPAELLRWLRDAVAHLTGRRGIAIAAPMRARWLLARKVGERLDRVREAERRSVYQGALFAEGARPAVSFEHAYEFTDGIYADRRKYRGAWKASRHFLGPDDIPAFDGKPGGKEEPCAQAIDALPEVRHWVRNVARHPQAFWLPLAGGCFYPDFVAELTDGRLMAIEYKGAPHAGSADTNEKRLVGTLWADRGEGACVFAMVERMRGDRDMRTQLTDAIAIP